MRKPRRQLFVSVPASESPRQWRLACRGSNRGLDSYPVGVAGRRPPWAYGVTDDQAEVSPLWKVSANTIGSRQDGLDDATAAT